MERRTITIPIRGISIELNFPKEMSQSTPENFNQKNFSIRGYAAENKRRNPKASDPFQFDDLEIEQLKPSPSATDTDIDDNDNPNDSDYSPSDRSDSETEDTDEELDDSMPLSQFRKAVTHRLRANSLKRRAEENHSLVTKKTKSAHIPIKISKRKSDGVKSGDLKGRSSRTRTTNGTTSNQDNGVTSSFQTRTDLCLAESIIPPAYGQDLLNLKKTDTPYALPNRRFLKPKERKNQGTLKSSIQTCEEQRHGKAMVQGSSDEFPIDILELMTRNQLERTHGINDDIVAMQLLSLKRGRSTGSKLNVGTDEFSDNPDQ